MAIFTAQVANYFGRGSSGTIHADGTWTLDTLCCELGRYRVRIVQNKEGIEGTKKKSFVHTTTIIIENIRTFKEGKIVVIDICALLSFASMSQVVAFDFMLEGGEHRIYSVRGVAMRFRPTLETQDGESILAFLRQVWQQYRILKKKRKLYAVLDMITFLDAPSRPVELKLAQIFIVMENLKGTYAQEKKIPFVAGFFRRISTPPKHNLKNEKPLHFEELFEEMLREVKMRHGLKRMIALRNEIIHFGLSRKNFRSMNSYYEKAHDIIREYLLRLLGYRGRFLVYSKASRVQKSLEYR